MLELKDIKDIYEIDILNIDGYKQLDDINKMIFRRFIVNFYNCMGLEGRALMKPLSINFVEEKNYMLPVEGHDYFIELKKEVTSIYKDGDIELLSAWINEEEDKNLIKHKAVVIDKERYLKFEYLSNNDKEWLHVVEQGVAWY